jgi:hypothetical protein
LKIKDLSKRGGDIKSSAIIAVLLFVCGTAMAQNPAFYHIIYGNRDGSPMTVMLGDTIELPVWGSTDPTPGNPDTVAFMNNSMASRDAIVATRYGGYSYEECDTIMPPQRNCPLPFWTSQTVTDFAYLHDPRTLCMLYTGGDTVLLYNLRMWLSSDSSLMGWIICPFADGCGGHLWGMQDGVRGVVPVQTYGCLYFSPCNYGCGDANNDGVFNGLDVVYSVNYLKGSGEAPPYTCECQGYGTPMLAADANGNCVFNGLDITFSVNYLKGIGPAPRRCPSC